MTRTKFKVVPGSQGSFMDPPGSPNRLYHVAEFKRSEEVSSVSLTSAKEYEWIPEDVRAQAMKIVAEAKIWQTEAWLAFVYSYFKNCYSPDGKSRNASDCLIAGSDNKPPAERSLAVLHIREWFPDHEPRLDLLDQSGGYGNDYDELTGEVKA